MKEKARIYGMATKLITIIAKGTSVAELSRNTKIGYYSLYNTYNTVKDKLKNDLL
jgi:lambda repressor-like predicted transcriptional regulator